jgi:predicted methyltransferase
MFKKAVVSFNTVLGAALVMVLTNTMPLFAGEPDFGRLSVVLSIQPADTKARYPFRHPQQTLEFFEIAPGMTVVEALPGQGWYTKILLPYLGREGTVIGADYSDGMYPLFGFFNEEQLAEQSRFITKFPADAAGWGGSDGGSVEAFKLGSLPDAMKGQADAVLFIRALHNLARFESQGGFLTEALQNAYDVLKPGGLVGVVQHEARDDKSDEFANGSRGYLKKSFVMQVMQDAGFQFVAESDINQNDKDQPGDDDIVWRLPPSLVTSRDNPGLKAEMEAIGESNRMTLLFRKPD